jgi:light-regulated signal transduction histidine kinase (bacteriophytochrome)
LKKENAITRGTRGNQRSLPQKYKGRVETPAVPESRDTEQGVELAVYQQALERARADMQSFAYSVSHDLRAPLRAIQGFSKILLDDFGGELQGEARQFLQHIIHNTQHLTSLMDDLLRYSRAGKNAPTKIDLDPANLVKEVLSHLKLDFPAAAQARIATLPLVHADPVMLRQALTELLSNAAKFSSKCESPQISVSGCADQYGVTISFQDNGVGFDQAHAGKLFQVFQKLHNVSDFPGNGMGLALVKRIIEAHGGCVDAEGKTGEGATFSIALPHANAAPLECLKKTSARPIPA